MLNFFSIILISHGDPLLCIQVAAKGLHPQTFSKQKFLSNAEYIQLN
jgi:hypothetical protein